MIPASQSLIANAQSPRLGVVLLNWRQPEETVACAECLLLQASPGMIVIIVENGSGDNSIAQLSAFANRNKAVYLLISDENRGFAGGCNLGISKCLSEGVEYVLLLNNDARLEDGAIEALLLAARNERVGIVGAVIRDSSSGRLLFQRRHWPEHLFGGGNQPGSPGEGQWQSDCIDGCAMLINRRLVEHRIAEDGYVFDEALFMYWEDDDLSVYANTRGYLTVVAPEAVVRHSVALSSGGWGNSRGFYYLTRNRIVLANRWLPWWARISFHIWYLPSRIAVSILRRAQRKKGAARAIMLGVMDGYFGRLGKWREHN